MQSFEPQGDLACQRLLRLSGMMGLKRMEHSIGLILLHAIFSLEIPVLPDCSHAITCHLKLQCFTPASLVETRLKLRRLRGGL